MFLSEIQIAKVREYLHQLSRYKLLIVSVNTAEKPFCTMNLSEWLCGWIAGEDRNEEDFIFRLHKEIETAMQHSVMITEEIGTVRVIDNIGIFFEPAVRMSPIELIKKYSKDCLLVIFWGGTKKGDRLYFPDENSNCIIDLTGINYLSI